MSHIINHVHVNAVFIYHFFSNPSEADISGHDLDLHITPEGHLTGNLQMTLPPIQSVLLNPYTG